MGGWGVQRKRKKEETHQAQLGCSLSEIFVLISYPSIITVLFSPPFSDKKTKAKTGYGLAQWLSGRAETLVQPTDSKRGIFSFPPCCFLPPNRSTDVNISASFRKLRLRGQDWEIRRGFQPLNILWTEKGFPLKQITRFPIGNMGIIHEKLGNIWRYAHFSWLECLCWVTYTVSCPSPFCLSYESQLPWGWESMQRKENQWLF